MTKMFRRRAFLSACLAPLLASALQVGAEPMPVRSAERDASGATLHLEKGLLRLEVRGERIVRVTVSLTDTLPEMKDFALVGKPAPTPFEWNEEAERYMLRTSQVVASVNRATGAVSFADPGGRTLLAEPADGGKRFAPAATGSDLFRVQQTFLSPTGEHLFGLSQSQDGIWNWRGLPIELRQVNTQTAFPMLVSSQGYGLLWNNGSLTDFNPIDNEIKLGTGNETSTTGPTATEQLQGVQPNSRARGARTGTFTTTEAGEYVFFAKDGDRRNDIGIIVDGKTINRIQNLWVPYTAVGRVTLPANAPVSVQLLGGGRSAKLFAAPAAKTTTFRSHFGQAIDYVFFAGPSLDQVVAGYRQTTGAAPMWPLWAYGFWQCRERYASQQQILDVAGEFRRRQIPLDLIVQDWQYWGPHGWGAYEWDESKYPDPAALTKGLHDQNVKFMVSVWSNPQGKAGAELSSKGFMFAGTDAKTHWVDVFNPAARQLRWDWLNKSFFSLGVDAWWQDATEPGDDGNAMAGNTTAAGPGDLHRNIYPLLANQTVYEGQRATDPDKRVVILTRAAFPGLQRYGAALWSGDIGGNWETLRRQVPAGLHVSVAGLPYWTTDAGGFFRPRDQYQSDDFAELLTRWFQWSTFCPIQRIHGYQSETEFWKLPKAERNLVEYARLRYRLMPYVYSTAWRVTNEGYTMMRPLAMDFASDSTALGVSDQYMFGPSLLVSPVTEPKATTRDLYLPGTERWTNFWSGETADGGRRVEVAAPLEQIPLFVRAGSILPIGPDRQYAAENKDGPIELRVYGGADGAFELYDDAGDSYRYEKGERSVIAIRWDEATRTLSFDDRKGEYPGMAKERVFRVVFVRPGHGVGGTASGGADVEVRYVGQKLTIPMPASVAR